MARVSSICIACVVCLSTLAVADTLLVDRTVPILCDGEFDVGNTALYNIAFEWTKHCKLDGWVYTEAASHDAGRECVRVTYSTQVQIHKLFESLLPTRILKTKIDKDVCLEGDVLQETVRLSDVVLIQTLQINIRAEIDRRTHTLRMLAHSDLAVPWFLQMFEAKIVREMEQSLAEYHELLASSVCKGRKG
jgi:hypothetical protein